MKRLIGFGVAAATAFTFAGCTYITAASSVQGKTYITDGSAFWNCDATSGDPVCYQVKQQYAPKAAAK